MMICMGDTVSGTAKRESQSEAFSAAPFTYSFHPIPLSEEGGYFIDSPSVEFSVNKTCDNLDMTNEFMRFLIDSQELNEMALVKRLVTPTKDLSFSAVYEPFGRVPAERVGDRVLNREGADVTEAYRRGAEQALYLCRLFGCKTAVLKSRSPSCGCREIYDGTFTGHRVPGMGMTAQLLSQAGVRVLTEEEL